MSLKKILFLPFISLLFAGGTARTEEATAESSLEDGWRLWLQAQQEYRARFSGGAGGEGLIEPLGEESDQDVRLQLEGEAVSPGEQFQAQLSAACWWDIDGGLSDRGARALGSVFDYQNPWVDVFRASADWRPGLALELLRAGRQPSEHGKEIVFDGLSAEFEASQRVHLFVFGGRTVHFFEAEGGLFEDWLGSAGLDWRVDRNWRAEFDYRLQLEQIDGENLGEREGRLDHSVGFSAWYRRSGVALSKFWLRSANDRPAEIGWRGSYLWPELDAGLHYLMFGQPARLRGINESQDPYFSILGESEPHLRWRLEGWKGFRFSWAHLSLHLGTDGRRLFETDKESPFNRSTGKAYGMFLLEDFIREGIYLAVSAEAHYAYEDGHLDSDWVFTASGYLGYRCPQRRFEAELGTAYQRYRLDYFRDVREVENSRLFYLSTRARLLQWLSLRARYEFERADRDYHTLSLTLVQTW